MRTRDRVARLNEIESEADPTDPCQLFRFQVLKVAKFDARLSKAMRHMLIGLAIENYNPDTPAMWPSYETIAENMGYSARAAKYLTQCLVALGYLIYRNRLRKLDRLPGDGKTMSNVWEFRIPQDAALAYEEHQRQLQLNPTRRARGSVYARPVYRSWQEADAARSVRSEVVVKDAPLAASQRISRSVEAVRSHMEQNEALRPLADNRKASHLFQVGKDAISKKNSKLGRDFGSLTEAVLLKSVTTALDELVTNELIPNRLINPPVVLTDRALLGRAIAFMRGAEPVFETSDPRRALLQQLKETKSERVGADARINIRSANIADLISSIVAPVGRSGGGRDLSGERTVRPVESFKVRRNIAPDPPE